MKKVLIITYYWPPSGGPGVQRWLKFVKYLREFEVEPVVYIPENPDYPIIDKSFEDEIPDGIQILRGKIFEPYALASFFSKKETRSISSGIIKKEENQNFLQKLLLYIRGNFFIPDARKFWINPSVKFLEKEIKKDEFHSVITTGPPHSLHLIGLRLKQKLDIRWIADFRDPWTTIGYHKKLRLTKRAHKKHEELENEVLKNANQIITTSFTTKAEFETKTRTPVCVITNGYDSDIEDVEVKPNTKFRISHVGSLLSDRDPQNLWLAIKELQQENDDFKRDLELRFAGKVSSEVFESLQAHGLQNFLEFDGYVEHSKAIEIQKASELLLLIEIDSIDTRGIIPGKLFEYLASKRPVLAIGPPDWDVESIVLETKAGNVFRYSEKEAIKEFIWEHYRSFKDQSFPFKVGNIEKYHRKSLTGRLATLIKEL